MVFFYCKQKTAYDIGLGIPAEPSSDLKKRGTECFLVAFNSPINILCRVSLFLSMALYLLLRLFVFRLLRLSRFGTLSPKLLCLIPIYLPTLICIATCCRVTLLCRMLSARVIGLCRL